MTQALTIGRAVLDARAKRRDVVERVIAATGATLFFTGKVTDIRRELKGGFARGEAQDRRQWATGRGARAASRSRTKTLSFGSTAYP